MVSGEAQRRGGRLPGGRAGREGPGSGLGMTGTSGQRGACRGRRGGRMQGRGWLGPGWVEGDVPRQCQPPTDLVCLSCLLHPVLIRLSVWPLCRAGSTMDCSCVSDLLFAPPALPALWTPGNRPRPTPPFPQPWDLPSPLASPFCTSHCLSSICPGSWSESPESHPLVKNLAKNFTARCSCHLPAETRGSFGGQVRCGGLSGTRMLGPEDLGSRPVAICFHPGPAGKEKQGDWRQMGADGAGLGTRGGTRPGAGGQVDRPDNPGRGTRRRGPTS